MSEGLAHVTLNTATHTFRREQSHLQTILESEQSRGPQWMSNIFLTELPSKDTSSLVIRMRLRGRLESPY